jgi:hypothetical protein
MAAAAIQGLAPALGVGSVDVGNARVARPLLPKAAGTLEGGFQKTWLAQKVLGLERVTG